MRFKNKHFCGRIDNFMTSLVIFNLATLNFKTKQEYLATEIEKEQKNMEVLLYLTKKLLDSGTPGLRDSEIFYMNDNIMKTQFFHKIKLDLKGH